MFIIMKRYVHKITTAIKFGYFEAILKESIENTFKFLLDNGIKFIYSRYVTENIKQSTFYALRSCILTCCVSKEVLL